MSDKKTFSPKAAKRIANAVRKFESQPLDMRGSRSLKRNSSASAMIPCALVVGSGTNGLCDGTQPSYTYTPKNSDGTPIYDSDGDELTDMTPLNNRFHGPIYSATVGYLWKWLDGSIKLVCIDETPKTQTVTNVTDVSISGSNLVQTKEPQLVICKTSDSTTTISALGDCSS
jgi:hypothetical protein